MLAATLTALIASPIVLLVLFVTWASAPRLDAETYAKGELVSLPPAAGAPEPDSKAQYRILTFNMGYASGMTNNTAERLTRGDYHNHLVSMSRALRELDPDITVLQEVDYDSDRSHRIDQLTALASGLNHRHRAKAYNWDVTYLPWPYWPLRSHFGAILSGQAVSARYPIAAHWRHVFDKPPSQNALYRRFYIDRCMHACELDVAGRRLLVVNVHLEAFDIPHRQRQARELARRLEPYLHMPMIVIGDFNAFPEWARTPAQLDEIYPEGAPHDRTLARFADETGLKSAFPQSIYGGSREAETYTFPADAPVAQLDHIFYSSQIQCVSARVVRELGVASDHLPVVMDFSFDGGEPPSADA